MSAPRVVVAFVVAATLAVALTACTRSSAPAAAPLPTGRTRTTVPITFSGLVRSYLLIQGCCTTPDGAVSAAPCPDPAAGPLLPGAGPADPELTISPGRPPHTIHGNPEPPVHGQAA